MNKHEFLNMLRETLEGQVGKEKIDENLLYYSNYIDAEMGKGKSESDILLLLGDPRLLAKTIIETNGGTRSNKTYTYSNEAADTVEDEFVQKGFHVSCDEQEGWDFRYGRFKLNTWYNKMLLIILVIVVVCIIGKIAIAILPIVFPIVLIFFLVSYFTGGRR